MKFVVKNTNTGVKFDLFRAKEDNAFVSSEVYTTRKTCLNGIESVKKNAAAAPVEDQTVENYAAEKCPKFEVYEDKAGKYRFRLKARNGQIVAHSDPFETAELAKEAVEDVKKGAGKAAVEK